MWRTILLCSVLLGIPALALAEKRSEPTEAPLVVPFSKHEKLVLDYRQFDPKKHTIHKGDGGWLIDGGLVFGTDHSMPANKLWEAHFVVGNRKISLDTSFMYNVALSITATTCVPADCSREPMEKDIPRPPWHPGKVANISLKTHIEGEAYDINADFSDGAGHYQVQWKILGAASVRTLLIQSEEGSGIFCQ